MDSGEETIQDLSGFSDYILARALMMKLWQMYDNGGVSMGRSLRAGLLESILPILPKPEEVLEISTLNIWDLYQEAEKRLKGRKKGWRQPFLFPQLYYIPDRTLTCLILKAMIAWYKMDEEKSDFPLIFQKNIVSVILGCLDSTFYKKQFSWSQDKSDPYKLIEEAGNRHRAKMEIDLRQRYGWW